MNVLKRGLPRSWAKGKWKFSNPDEELLFTPLRLQISLYVIA
jgi:hypothetical protein